MSGSQQLNIEPLTCTIGAIVHNFDLSRPLTSDQKHALEDALYKYHVLFFRKQNLTPEQQRDFAFQFGQPYVHPTHKHVAGCPEVTNFEFGIDVNPNEKPGADTWHTDGKFLVNPPIIGMLYARIIPKQGGDTLWVNMVEVYKQNLSNEMKQFLSKLTAEHSFEKNYKLPINSNPADIEKYIKAVKDNPPVNYQLICEHPHTKEKYLYTDKIYTTKINELNKEESDLLLKYLFSLVNKRPELTCRWQWNENDVCLWDERTTQHYGAPDYWPQHRQMYRCIHLPYGDEYCSQERVALAGSDFQRQLVFSRVEDSARPVNQRRLSVISEIYYPIEHEESRHESTINEAPVQAESNKRRRQILFIAEPIIISSTYTKIAHFRNIERIQIMII
ncbi:unnamed protein product [Rotaria sordida]|uniref:TauD/TfdA-like domain-containing protein n=1 Tax=Rotaria sordida TaxID=392033 RepID=A0A814PPQ2_9BILA|nr:unnamed protein product [Rotaria sordida]CAF3735795.1 unnamed protein product [Rotaria sordida]